jgi:serine/threonine-protein kinase
VTVLALLALGSGYYLGSYRYTRAPAVLGMSLAEATAALEKAGLDVRRGPDAFSETVARGRVLGQDPDPQDKVRKDGTVTLQLSKGPDRRAVPRLAGLTLEQARSALAAVGLVVAEGPTSAFSSEVPKGQVISSEPAAGTRLKAGTPVRLVLSKGKELVTLPDVRGETEAGATAQLQEAGFRVAVDRVFSDTVRAGLVVAQSPGPGTAEKASTVTLQVSKGPDVVTVPNVVGMQEAQAEAALQAAGLRSRTRQFPGGSGKVRFTDPSAGSTVKRGSTVTIFVY